jgi:hypothetical protein
VYCGDDSSSKTIAVELIRDARRQRISTEQFQLVRPRHSFCAVSDAQLAVNIRDVALDGVQTDEQKIGNLLVPHSCHNKTQDFDLTRR